MIWAYIGWGVIGFAALLMILLPLFLKNKGQEYARRMPSITSMLESQVAAMEDGYSRQVVIGQRLLSPAYPGLGLQGLKSLPAFLDPDTLVEGQLKVASSDGALVLFAQQIIQQQYREGFSIDLKDAFVTPILPGPTPFSFTAGLLADPASQTRGPLVLLGHYGPEFLLLTVMHAEGGGQAFAAAGSISSQAVNYLNVRDLLIGEQVFMLSSLNDPQPLNQAGWITEDILRVLLMLVLVVFAVLKIIGVL